MPEEIQQQPISQPTAVPSSPSAPTPAQSVSSSPAAPEVVSQPAANQFSLLDYATSQGVDVSGYQDPSELASHLFNELRQAKAVASWAQQNIQPKEPDPQPPAPEQDEWSEESYFNKRWDVPTYDKQWEAMVQTGAIEKDRTGKWVPASGHEWLAANPALAQLNAWESRRSDKLQQYLNGNLPRQLYEDLREPLDRRYLTKDELNKILEERQTQQYLGTVEDRLAPMLYKNPGEVPAWDDPRFAQNLTEYGQRFFQVVDDLMSLSPNAPQKVILEKALRYAPPPSVAPSQPVQQPPVVPQQAAPPAAPAPAPMVAPKPQSTFLDDAMQRASHRPSGSTPPASPVDPKRLSSQEVRTMFVRAAERAS